MKILLIKLSALGDIVQTFPALSYLRSRYPFAEIDWIVDTAGAALVQAHPDIDRVYTCPLHLWLRQGWTGWRKIFVFLRSMPSYSLVYDLQGNMKSACVLAFIRSIKKVGFDRHHVAEWPNLLFTHEHIRIPKGGTMRQDYLSLVQGFLGDTTTFQYGSVELKLTQAEQRQLTTLPRGKVIVCPFAQWHNKCLPIDDLVAVLQEESRPLAVLCSSPTEQQKARQLIDILQEQGKDIEILPFLSLPLVQHLFAQSALVIAMDSLPLHLAATTTTPTQSFFGPSSLHKYKPEGDQHQGWMGLCPFRKKFEKRCPRLRSCQNAPCIRNSWVHMPSKRSQGEISINKNTLTSTQS